MATIKLIDSVWLDNESEKVKGVLFVMSSGSAGKPGFDVAELRAELAKRGLHYDNADLVLIRDKLVADGVIEIIP